MATTTDVRREGCAVIATLLLLLLLAIVCLAASPAAVAKRGHRHPHKDSPPPAKLGYNDNFNKFDLHTPKPLNPLTGLPLPFPIGTGGTKPGQPTRVPSGGELIKRARVGGADVIRYVIPWARVERRQGVYDWSVEDGTYNLALKAGLRPVIVLFTSPCWAHESLKCDTTYRAVRPDPDHVADFARFARAAVERYPQAAAFEVWNESNMERYWGPSPSPVPYVKMLAAVHQDVAPLGKHPPILYNGLSPKPHWQRYMKLSLINRHAGKYVDGVGIHPYVGSGGVKAVRKKVEDAERIISKAHAPTKTWITEIGWSTAGDIDNGVSATAQAARIDKLLQIAPKLGLKGVIIHRLQDISGESAWETGAGVLNGESQPKPIYCTLGLSYGLRVLPDGC